MKITGAKIRQGDSILTVKVADNSLKVRDMLGIVYKNKEYCFNVVSVEVSEDEVFYIITAHEVGYYSLLSKQGTIDREILKLEPYLITDEQKIRQINNENTYC